MTVGGQTSEVLSVNIDDRRLWFLRGVLAAFASNRQTVTYDEIRRLCRFNDEQLGTYLDHAREPLHEAGQPDYCAIVVKTSGVPGELWGNASEAPREALQAHQFWQDRRALDNKEFEARHGSLPALPGLPQE